MSPTRRVALQPLVTELTCGLLRRYCRRTLAARLGHLRRQKLLRTQEEATWLQWAVLDAYQASVQYYQGVPA